MDDENENLDPKDEILSLRHKNATLERILQESQEASRTKLVQAELKAHAAKAGMIDLDGLKLINSSDLTVDENGEIQGAAALMVKIQREKPWLFTQNNSSSLANVPANIISRNKNAKEMTLKEWRDARAELIRRR